MLAWLWAFLWLACTRSRIVACRLHWQHARCCSAAWDRSSRLHRAFWHLCRINPSWCNTFVLSPLDIWQFEASGVSAPEHQTRASINVGLSAASGSHLALRFGVCLRRGWGQDSSVPEVLLAGILVVKKNLPVLAPAYK